MKYSLKSIFEKQTNITKYLWHPNLSNESNFLLTSQSSGHMELFLTRPEAAVLDDDDGEEGEYLKLYWDKFSLYRVETGKMKNL